MIGSVITSGPDVIMDLVIESAKNHYYVLGDMS
jgi:hypothetical protein